MNFDTVRSRHSRSRGKPLACVPANRSAEPNSLVVRVDFDDRTDLLAGDPYLASILTCWALMEFLANDFLIRPL